MKKVKMQLFGSLLLSCDSGNLGEEKLRSNKLTRLLAYLLIHRGSALTHHQLIEVFWEDAGKNPEVALKNMMYRVRNELKALGKEKFICTVPGAYRWNPEIEVETDYEAFEQMVAKLRATVDQQEQETLCRSIIAGYKNNITAKIADESWILPKVIWYQSAYLDAVKQLCTILGPEERWSEVEMICHHALQVDALDEDIHCYLIRSLSGQKKYDLALTQYEKASRLFYENMGIQNPEKLQVVFSQITTETGEQRTDIGKFLEEAGEQIGMQGAFFCDYQIFRQIYQMEMRRINRLGIAEFIILFTLRRKYRIQTGEKIDHGMIEGMNILERVVRASLRMGDVAAKYSPIQVAVLLPICTYEAGVQVADRICNNFRESIGKRRLELLYELAELSPPG